MNMRIRDRDRQTHVSVVARQRQLDPAPEHAEEAGIRQPRDVQFRPGGLFEPRAHAAAVGHLELLQAME
jgi:hypothetical protein